ncbi:unnamed protein product [Adineta steineri]|uniref:ADP ribosyltransferase domain-containing protein n=1 Tax=Adineta steineri TaxID=433720 RepID=A0A818HS73_9BILA|nr:unnamed protein product [Adineta steineri]CAF3512547.1 unnamed protein product [Adineta steineri]
MDRQDSKIVNRFTRKNIVQNSTNPAEGILTSIISPLNFETHTNDDYPKRRIIQNFFLIWIDSNMNKFSINYQDIITQLRRIVNTIYTYTNINTCIDFLSKIGIEKTFLIVSSSLCEELIPLIHDISQLDTIYIFDTEKAIAGEYINKWSKVKGPYLQILSICEALEQDIKQCNRNDTPVSFVPPNENASDQDLNQLDPSFMYTEIFKEILLKNQYNQKSIEDFVTFCRQQYDANPLMLETIDEFERDYNDKSSIKWYTRTCFTFEMLNRALRNLEVDTIITMSFFINDLHRQIEQLHSQQLRQHQKESFTVYRGQGLAETEFEKLMKAKGGLMSFNSFLSTSIHRNVSFMYAESNSGKMNTIGILYEIEIDPLISLAPFARIDNISYYEDEGEILFSMHTIFRIGEIKSTEGNTRLWQVKLELTNTKDQQLSTLTNQIRQETLGSTGYERLGKLLIKIGQFQKAEELYQVLLNQTNDEQARLIFYQQIGDIRDASGDYENAISYYEKASEIIQSIPLSDQSQLGTIYMKIAAVYMKMKENSKAALFNEKGTEILRNNFSREKNLPRDSYLNHPDSTTSYIDIGEICNRMNEFSKALSYQEKALEISQVTFPSNHPHLATSYNNIGVVYHNMGEYSKALSLYEKACEIFQQILPSNHPSLATTYNNIGAVYKHIGEYSKALSYHEKALEIRQKSLSSTHPDLAISQTNIGMVYEKIGEYSNALSNFERALDIFSRSLPANHPDTQAVRNNIERVRQIIT